MLTDIVAKAATGEPRSDLWDLLGSPHRSDTDNGCSAARSSGDRAIHSLRARGGELGDKHRHVPAVVAETLLGGGVGVAITDPTIPGTEYNGHSAGT